MSDTPKLDDGGPAFPCEVDWSMETLRGRQTANAGGIHMGLSLRDYYAAHAPISYVDAWYACGYKEAPKHDTERLLAVTILALLRYEYADAMLSERLKEKDLGKTSTSLSKPRSA